MQKSIKDYLAERLAQAAGVGVDQVNLEHPEAEEHGDYSSNIAMTMFSKSQTPSSKLQTSSNDQTSNFKHPRELAENIAKLIKPDEMIAKVDVAGPGFVNIWLQNEYLVGELRRVINEGQRYGNGLALSGKRVMIEFTDPNPFKEFHIGHLYSNIVGESLCRLVESQGADVWRVNYQGDVGLHVAKSIWGMRKLASEMPKERADLSSKAGFLGRAYASGAKAYEEDQAAKVEIEVLNRKIYAGESEVKEVYEIGRRWSLKYFDAVYERLGTKFNKFYFESEAGRVGLELVKAHLADEVFEESEGAVVFRGEKHGLHTRVFINSAGLPTYEAKELGLAPTKYKDFAYDLSVIVTGNEINEYFKVLLKALELVSPTLAAKTRHVSHGMVRLPTGKMSSRTGGVITGVWLLDQAAAKVGEVAPEAPDKETVGKAAVKYALLRSGVGRDIEFDFRESVSFEGNSGPYLQYTYARTRSVLAKSQVPISEVQRGSSYNKQEIDILRYIYRFPEVVGEAAARYAPNLICNFLYELAQRFNTFYNQHSILSADTNEAKSFRLALTVAVGQVIKNGLYLLGIEAPDRM